MKCILTVNLFCFIYYSTSQYVAVTRRQPKTHCENSNKNTLVEHFFNIIFTEFYSTPPVCVCVQMCAGQSTYCYPNGCFKAVSTIKEENGDAIRTIETSKLSELQKNKNQFILVKDEKIDFMADFLEKNYVDDSKTASQKIVNPIRELRPDPFKNKYSILGKFKRVPKVELRYNLQEKVKNAKYDSMKIEGIDRIKTRWPVKMNIESAHKMFSEEKPLNNKANFFAAMLPENEVVEYPPKYFKRDITKTADSDDVNIKAFYVLENSLNGTDGKSFSIETLIDTLIRSSFGTSVETTTNVAIVKRNDTDIDPKATIEKVVSVNSTGFTNETTSVISMNFTNENIDRNKYADDTLKMNKTSNLNEMITYLAKEIEKQNNTSLEIAKRVVEDFNETTLKTTYDETLSTQPNPSESSYDEKIVQPKSTIITTVLDIESTTSQEMSVTKKNRQRAMRKLTGSKMN